MGTGVVLISLLLTWYRVTITAAGLQYLESLERALFPGLYGRIAAGLGGLGPLTTSVSALGKGAGGWRWTILVVSSILILEVLLAIGTGTGASPSVQSGSHSAILLVLTTTNLILVAAAFFDLPFGGTPAAYITVSRGLGAYVGLAAALVACGGAVARLVKTPAK